ncbi:hypothetical protein V5O48_009628 [Marasmius crinis-equi]|uniref:Uncharacterized protein n=1 Tax=Marasmius crinis-equi TaxID=585013 RepID=A0ABR3FAJ2_9AGAR
MGAADRLFTRFLSRPPEKIDLNDLDSRCEGILEALAVVSNSLATRDVRTPGVARALDKHWPRVWDWILVFSRAAIGNPHALSDRGILAAECLTISVTNLFIYPTFLPGFERREETLIPLIKVAPAILGLTTELWLWTTEIFEDVNPSIPQHLMHSSYLLLLNYNSISMDPGLEALKTDIENHLSCVIRDERWDIGLVFVKGIIRETGQDPIYQGKAPHEHIVYLNTLIAYPRPLVLGKLIRNDVIRWVLLLMERYISLPARAWATISTVHEVESKVELTALCLSFIRCCIDVDVYFSLQALDEGLLLTVFKAASLLQNKVSSPTIENRNGPDTHTESALDMLVSHLVGLFRFLTSTAPHYPILVRLVCWIRKLKKLGFDNDDDRAFSGYAEIRDSWRTLKGEVSRRHALMYETGRFQSILICGDKQKRAWKSDHKAICDRLNEGIRDGSWARRPSYFDLAFMRQQVISDMESVKAEEIDQVLDAYYQDSTTPSAEASKAEAEGIVWIDYAVWPPKLTVRSVKESCQLVVEYREEYAARLFMDETESLDGLEAIATVPWLGSQTNRFSIVLGIYEEDFSEKGGNEEDEEHEERESDSTS